MITFEQLKKDEGIRAYIAGADKSLRALGYTDHSFPHVLHVAETAGYILRTLNYPEHDVELVKIAGYLHDIGNLVNRSNHSLTGAVMAFQLMQNMDIEPEDIATVSTAIGNHDEGTGIAVNPIAAALILADKSDVRRSRVRNQDPAKFDIHDRVNFSVMKSMLRINEERTDILLELTVDPQYSSVMDYFEIFMTRMQMCRKAAAVLGLEFRLNINDQQLI